MLGVGCVLSVRFHFPVAESAALATTASIGAVCSRASTQAPFSDTESGWLPIEVEQLWAGANDYLVAAIVLISTYSDEKASLEALPVTATRLPIHCVILA